MDKEGLNEALNEYRDANSTHILLNFLKERLVKELENIEVSSDTQRHDLNLLIRDLEEELDYIETEKLAEFDPEQQ